MDRANTKVEYYRRQAMHLRESAQRKPEGPGRNRILNLAVQYDRRAERVAAIAKR
jgi:hypothetical protein